MFMELKGVIFKTKEKSSICCNLAKVKKQSGDSIRSKTFSEKIGAYVRYSNLSITKRIKTPPFLIL